jgi:PadR family transcriptional regulator PadR
VGAQNLLQVTLDLLVTKRLALEPMIGWGIAQHIQRMSKEVLQLGQGCSIQGCAGQYVV